MAENLQETHPDKEISYTSGMLIANNELNSYDESVKVGDGKYTSCEEKKTVADDGIKVEKETLGQYYEQPKSDVIFEYSQEGRKTIGGDIIDLINLYQHSNATQPWQVEGNGMRTQNETCEAILSALCEKYCNDKSALKKCLVNGENDFEVTVPVYVKIFMLEGEDQCKWEEDDKEDGSFDRCIQNNKRSVEQNSLNHVEGTDQGKRLAPHGIDNHLEGFNDKLRSKEYGTEKHEGLDQGQRSAWHSTEDCQEGFDREQKSAGQGIEYQVSAECGSENHCGGFNQGKKSSKQGSDNQLEGFNKEQRSVEHGADNYPEQFYQVHRSYDTKISSTEHGPGDHPQGFDQGSMLAEHRIEDYHEGIDQIKRSAEHGTENHLEKLVQGNRSEEYGTKDHQEGFDQENRSAEHGTENHLQKLDQGSRSNNQPKRFNQGQGSTAHGTDNHLEGFNQGQRSAAQSTDDHLEGFNQGQRSAAQSTDDHLEGFNQGQRSATQSTDDHLEGFNQGQRFAAQSTDNQLEGFTQGQRPAVQGVDNQLEGFTQGQRSAAQSTDNLLEGFNQGKMSAVEGTDNHIEGDNERQKSVVDATDNNFVGRYQGQMSAGCSTYHNSEQFHQRNGSDQVERSQEFEEINFNDHREVIELGNQAKEDDVGNLVEQAHARNDSYSGYECVFGEKGTLTRISNQYICNDLLVPVSGSDDTDIKNCFEHLEWNCHMKCIYCGAIFGLFSYYILHCFGFNACHDAIRYQTNVLGKKSCGPCGRFLMKRVDYINHMIQEGPHGFYGMACLPKAGMWSQDRVEKHPVHFERDDRRAVLHGKNPGLHNKFKPGFQCKTCVKSVDVFPNLKDALTHVECVHSKNDPRNFPLLCGLLSSTCMEQICNTAPVELQRDEERRQICDSNLSSVVQSSTDGYRHELRKRKTKVNYLESDEDEELETEGRKKACMNKKDDDDYVVDDDDYDDDDNDDDKFTGHDAIDIRNNKGPTILTVTKRPEKSVFMNKMTNDISGVSDFKYLFVYGEKETLLHLKNEHIEQNTLLSEDSEEFRRCFDFVEWNCKMRCIYCSVEFNTMAGYILHSFGDSYCKTKINCQKANESKYQCIPCQEFQMSKTSYLSHMLKIKNHGNLGTGYVPKREQLVTGQVNDLPSHLESNNHDAVLHGDTSEDNNNFKPGFQCKVCINCAVVQCNLQAALIHIKQAHLNVNIGKFPVLNNLLSSDENGRLNSISNPSSGVEAVIDDNGLNKRENNIDYIVLDEYDELRAGDRKTSSVTKEMNDNYDDDNGNEEGGEEGYDDEFTVDGQKDKEIHAKSTFESKIRNDPNGVSEFRYLYVFGEKETLLNLQNRNVEHDAFLSEDTEAFRRCFDFVEWNCHMRCIHCSLVFYTMADFILHIFGGSFYCKTKIHCQKTKKSKFQCTPCHKFHLTKFRYLAHMLKTEYHGYLGPAFVPKREHIVTEPQNVENGNHGTPSLTGPSSKNKVGKFQPGFQCKKCTGTKVVLESLPKALQHITSVHKVERARKEIKKITKFMCDVCGDILRCKQSYRKHMHVNHEERANDLFGKSDKDSTFLCPHCGKKFMSYDYSNFKRHLQTHSGPVTCEICHKVEPHKRALLSHRQIFHGKSKRDSYTCVCGKTFKNSRNYYSHKRIHALHGKDYKYVCEICQKQFLMKHHLKNHMHVHSTSRYFVCDACGADFKMAHHLRNHKKNACQGKKSAACQGKKNTCQGKKNTSQKSACKGEK